jgi:RHS repeat-associated protein
MEPKRKDMKRIYRSIAGVILALAASLTGWAQSVDYGAVPTVMKPQGDQFASNQKLDFHTDQFTGRFGYSIPIEVPPGRGGSEPALALSYSSSDGNGWCGVGWDLDAGYIQRETRHGVPLNSSLMEYDDDFGFVYSVAGQSGRLVRATDGTYRPEINTAGLKFVYSGTWWTVTDKGGRTYVFGRNAVERIGDWQWGTFKWALSTTADPDGNQTIFNYQTNSDRQLYLKEISYNTNSAGPALAANCTITFGLESNRLDKPGSAMSGMDIYTSQRLKNIWVKCNNTQVRHYVLQYTNSSSTGKSLLQSVTEYGPDDSAHWPAKTFSYSSLSKSFLPSQAWNISTNSPRSEPGSQKTRLVDVNGDGLPDWVTTGGQWNGSYVEYKRFMVQLNTGSGFAAPQYWAINNENNDDSSSWWNWLDNYGVPYGGGSFTTCTLEDINGDGLQDRLMTPDGSGYFQVQLNTGSDFNFVGEWRNVPSGYYYSPNVTTPGFWAPASTTVNMLLDMNGDGLPDVVTEGSTYSKLNVTLNTGQSGFGGYFSVWDVEWENFSGNNWMRHQDNYGTYSEMVDLNGDGLPDHIQTGGAQLNLGPADGFSNIMSWGLTNNEAFGIIDENINGDGYYGCFSKQLLDINGDGLPDLVTANKNGTYSVRLNTGRGFSTNVVVWSGIETSMSYGLNSWSRGINSATVVTFADLNGDGLPDRILDNTYLTNNCLLVQLNAGPYPDLLTNINNGIGGTVTVTYTNSTAFDNSDGTRSWLPNPVKVVTSVTVNDGIRAGLKTSYNYAGGFFDPTNREFHGFAMVEAEDYYGTLTRTYFHQGGGLNRSAYGEYQDTQFKAGIPYDIAAYGTDGLLYHRSLRKVEQVKLDANGIYFPYVQQDFEITVENGRSRSTLTTNAYFVTVNNLAASSGNLRQEVFCGEVTNVSWSFTYAPVADANAPLYTTYTYASLANTNIIDKPASVTISTDAAGNNVLRRTEYAYFGNTGNLQKQSVLVCPGTYADTSYTYDAYGNPQTITDPAGVVTTTKYDDASATFPVCTTVGSLTNSFQYDPGSGVLLASTNEQGLVTANAYDGLWRLTGSAISTNAYGPPVLARSSVGHLLNGISAGISHNCEVASRNDPTSPTGWHTTLTYLDGLGRPIQVRDGSETNNVCRVTDLFYNWRGQLMSQSYPGFDTGTNFVAVSGKDTNTYTLFDPIGRASTLYPLVKATYTGGKLSSYTALTGDTGSPAGPTQIDYRDGNNPWAVVVTDPKDHVRKYLLDSLGRTNQIVEVTSAGNYTTTLQYNRVGDLTNLTDHAGNSMAMFYDLRGQRVALADPDMGLWQYGFDLAGRLKTQTDAKGQKIKFYYADAAGRLTRREAWSAGGTCLSTNTWAYDSSGGDAAYAVFPGQTFAVTDDEGWQKYSYDARNRTLKSVRYLAKNGTSYTNQFAFDDADRLTATTLPNGGPTLTNLFDAGGHLKTVTQIGGTGTVFYTARGFNALNQLNGVNFGNGVATTYGYYTVSKRLQQITTASIQSLAYKYDAVGNITNIVDGVYTGSASATVGKIQYDDLNRLMSLTNANGSFSYGYSPIGNVLTNKESGSNSYTYGTIRPHCVRSANGVDYTYDLNGNVSMRGKQHLFHDANNRLCKVWNTNGVITTFGYAADGARLWEQSGTNALQVWIGGNYEEKDGQILYHIYADGRQVCTFDKAGTNVWQYYHPDNLGSTAIQSDKSGNLIQSFTYSAFGQSRYTLDANLFKPSRRYTGQVLDEGTGLYYYNFRYYIPELARFAEGDDIIPDLANPQSYNRYSYVMNNPLRFTDPTGHAGWEQALNDFADAMMAASPQTAAIEKGAVGVARTAPKAARALEYSAVAVAKGSAAAVKETGGLIKAVTEVVESSSRLKTAEKMASSLPNAKTAETAAKNLGRSGKQERLRELADAPNTSSADRGWIKNEQRQIEQGNRDTIRNPPGKDLAHERGREAAKGYSYEHSNLQDRDLHRTQHKFDDFGRANKERPLDKK